MIVKSIRTYVPVKGEHNRFPSLTVPDQALTPAELLIRFAQGRPLTKANDMVYTGDEYLPDPRSMDIEEMEQLKMRTDQRIKEIDEKLRKRKPDANKKPEVNDNSTTEDVEVIE